MALRIKKVFLYGCATLFLLLLLVVLEERSVYGIPCVFYELTGFFCPGCGTTRAIISLTKLEFYQAFRYNPLFIIILPFLATAVIRDIVFYIKDIKAKQGPINTFAAIVFIVVCVFYAGARNTHLFEALAPTIPN